MARPLEIMNRILLWGWNIRTEKGNMNDCVHIPFFYKNTTVLLILISKKQLKIKIIDKKTRNMY